MNKGKIRGEGFSSEIRFMVVCECTLKTFPLKTSDEAQKEAREGLERFQINFFESFQKVRMRFHVKRPKLFPLKFSKK